MNSAIVHASFSVERTFPEPPARVFAAFAELMEPANPSAASSSRATLLTSSPSTSTSRLSCRMVVSSRRPLKSVSAAIAPGTCSSSRFETSAAAS